MPLSLLPSPDQDDLQGPGEWRRDPRARPLSRPHAQQQFLCVEPQFLYGEGLGKDWAGYPGKSHSGKLPCGDPDLGPSRPQLSGSLKSLSGEAEAGPVQVRGSVLFSLRYEPGTGELRVQVIQCQGLAAARRRRSDP